MTMEKDILENFAHLDLLRKHVLPGEPALSGNEKKKYGRQ